MHLDSHHLLSLDFHHLADVAKFILQLGLQLESDRDELLAGRSRGGRHEGRSHRDGDGEQRGVVGVGGAPEEQSRKTLEQVVAVEVISTMDEG